MQLYLWGVISFDVTAILFGRHRIYLMPDRLVLYTHGWSEFDQAKWYCTVRFANKKVLLSKF